jgi:leucyl/phenylalanyl-tRNA--protein transferase
MMLSITLLPEDDDTVPFPPVEHALREPNGLLAVGGNLRPRRILQAYRRGIFPWFASDEPILWWSPDPRCVLFPEDFHASRSLRRTWRRGHFRLTRDRAFAQVIRGCAEPRVGSPGTWILPSMVRAYEELHRQGFATSIECWAGDELAGGIYGVQLGQVFFGESMFSRRDDASKMALWQVASEPDIELIDCQLSNPHLRRLGATTISRPRYLRLLARLGV